MTRREKLCLRILLFVAKCLAREDWRTAIDGFDLQIAVDRDGSVSQPA